VKVRLPPRLFRLYYCVRESFFFWTEIMDYIFFADGANYKAARIRPKKSSISVRLPFAGSKENEALLRGISILFMELSMPAIVQNKPDPSERQEGSPLGLVHVADHLLAGTLRSGPPGQRVAPQELLSKTATCSLWNRFHFVQPSQDTLRAAAVDPKATVRRGRTIGHQDWPPADCKPRFPSTAICSDAPPCVSATRDLWPSIAQSRLRVA
jgi:hypothetical protein